jgi:LPXTG-motif cell wall-anchored protein
MVKQSFTENAGDIFVLAKSYVKTRIELWKLSLLEKISKAGTFFLVAFIMVIIIAFCLIFISLAFAFWYGQMTGDLATGFLILAGFYLLLGLILILARKRIILTPIIRVLSSIMYDEDKDIK